MLRTVYEETFYQCENLRNVKFPENLKTIGINAFCETRLESVRLPAQLRVIAQGTFAKCDSLRTVKFKDGLEVLGTNEYADDGKIWYGVFQESSVEHVDLPASLKRIEYCAF